MKHWQEEGETGMTKTDRDLIIKLIINLVETSKSKEEVLEKLKALLND